MHRSRLLCALTALAPLAAAAQPAMSVQLDGDRRGPSAYTGACFDTLPASVLTRVPVYLEARVRDPRSAAILPAADILAQMIAERARLLLGGTPGALPRGEPEVTWRELAAGLSVTLHRDGRFAWSAPASSRTTRGAALVARALTDLRDAGERLSWPDGVAADSVAVRLVLWRPIFGPDGAIVPLPSRVAVAVFTVAAPWERPIEVVRRPVVTFPETSRRDSLSGSLFVRFEVDTTGRVDLRTVRDDWPAGEARPPGAVLGDSYRTFLAAVRIGLARARYEPARVGGCAVRDAAQQRFEFQLRR